MPDTPEAVIESHEEGLAVLLENTLNDPAFIIGIAGALGAEYIDMTGQFLSPASTDAPMTSNSEDESSALSSSITGSGGCHTS